MDVEECGPEAMDVKERKPYRSLTRRRDAERRYTSSSADSEEGKAPQKSYSSSETLKAYDQDARLAYSSRVKDLVPQEAEEFCRAGESRAGPGRARRDVGRSGVGGGAQRGARVGRGEERGRAAGRPVGARGRARRALQCRLGSGVWSEPACGFSVAHPPRGHNDVAGSWAGVRPPGVGSSASGSLLSLSPRPLAGHAPHRSEGSCVWHQQAGAEQALAISSGFCSVIHSINIR